MARAQAGDRRAFDALFKDIGPFITRSLPLHLSRTEVEDICQEILIAVYKSQHTYQPQHPFEPWLFAIIRNVVTKHLGRDQNRVAVQVQMDQLPELCIEGRSGLEMEFREALEQLPHTQIEALVLTKLLGLSVAEVARRTGTSVGSIKVRVHRAYQSLKRSLLE